LAKDNLDIEKPELVLDIEDNAKKIDEKEELPEEIPPLLDELVSTKMPKDDIEMDALIKDVEIYIEIGDLEQAHEAYQRLNRVYIHLKPEIQKDFYEKLQALFKEIRDYNTFGAKLKRAFRKKPKAPKEDAAKDKDKKSKKKLWKKCK